MAADIGIELLTEEQYRELQRLGNFDAKTSSWVKTPPDIRKLGGAIFVITATARYSCITMVQNLTMEPGISRFAESLNFNNAAKRRIPIHTIQLRKLLNS